MKAPPKTLHLPTLRQCAEYLLAILGGNIVYYWLYPQLPLALQHQTFRVDLGLGLDFALCAAVYGVIRAIRPARPN